MVDSPHILEVRDAALLRRGQQTRDVVDFRVEVPELTLAPGSVTAILGPSGVGKTTMLLGLLGLGGVECVAGTVAFCGATWPRVGSSAWRSLLFEDVCLLLQDAVASLDPVQTVLTQIAAVTGAEQAAIESALEGLGVEDMNHVLAAYPHQLSGGQARRVMLAIALLRGPKLVVADEPSSGLDEDRKRDLVQSLELLQERTGCALLISTHDHDLAASLGAVPYSFEGQRLVSGWPEKAQWPSRQRNMDVDAPAVLAAENLTVRHRRTTLLQDVDMAVRQGEIVALTGSSGAGKTTLARALVGQLTRRSGFQVCGKTVRPQRVSATQLLYQNAHGSLTPHLSLRAMLDEVHAEDFDIEAEAAAVGLDASCLDRRPAHLSGGERRRAALLRALAVRPDVLILDEPTASLDRGSAVAVIETLLRAQQRCKLAILWITHDLGLAEAIADTVLKMEAGRLCS